MSGLARMSLGSPHETRLIREGRLPLKLVNWDGGAVGRRPCRVHSFDATLTI